MLIHKLGYSRARLRGKHNQCGAVAWFYVLFLRLQGRHSGAYCIILHTLL